jgi:hypothetical protein
MHIAALKINWELVRPQNPHPFANPCRYAIRELVSLGLTNGLPSCPLFFLAGTGGLIPFIFFLFASFRPSLWVRLVRPFRLAAWPIKSQSAWWPSHAQALSSEKKKRRQRLLASPYYVRLC